MLVITYEFVNHGADHPDYFPGCGVAFTKFDDCYTGIGNTPYEAAEDALAQSTEHIAWNDAILEDAENEMKQFLAPYEKLDSDSELQYFVSLRIRIVT